jgi:hypothetical protein
MGEAKRRDRGQADRLPSFIFTRDRETEQRDGLLARWRVDHGYPERRRRSAQGEDGFINKLIDGLMGVRMEDGDVDDVVGMWRAPEERRGGMEPPYPDSLMLPRIEGCISVAVRILPPALQDSVDVLPFRVATRDLT